MKNFFQAVFRFIGAILALIRNVMVIGMIVIAVAAIYFIRLVANVTIEQYNESLVWEGTAYEEPLAQIEPTLVANVVDTEAVDAVNAWDALEHYVDSLGEQGITDKAAAGELLDQAVHWQETYGLQSEAITRLSLYLELEDAITDAYATLNTEELQALAARLYALEMQEQTEAGQQYMERIRTVSADFEEAKKLMSDTVLSVGKVKDGVWIIPYTCTRTDLTEVLEQVQAMQKFPALSETVDVLSNITDVLNYNTNTRDYFAYQDFKKKIEKLTRSDYVPVSSLYDYGQARSFGCEIQMQSKAGYTVSLKSKVAGIYYEGDRLDDNDYVKKGTHLTAVINEVYEPIPVVETPVEIPAEVPVEGMMESYE